MKKYLFIAATLLLLCGCGRDEADTVPQPGPQAVTVSLAVRAERMTAVTRTTDEETIRDVNLYLYNDNGEIVLHRYQTSSTLRFECVPGNYMLRIVANLGRDLGNNPVWADVAIVHADEYDSLPMAWEGDMTIPAAGGALPAVEVQRAVAKVSYNIAVKPADIELLSLRLRSVPRTASVFDAAAVPSDNPGDYTECPEAELSGRQASGDCYLLPNMQGKVSSITDQRQKNRDNAPENASYLLIRATRGAKMLAYYIYLGENNTSDFNVRANVHYRLDISILGDSEVDTRVSSYAVDVHDTYGENTVGGYCTYNPSQMLAVEIDGNPAPLTLRGHITVARGDAGAFFLNGSPVGNGCDLTLTEQPGPNVFGVNYAPEVYTAANSQVVYTVTVGDDAGFAQSFDIGHRFANRLRVVVGTAANGKGSVAVSGALYDAETSALTHDRVVLCHEKGCTLTALPAAGYRFDGWYSAADYKTRLSTSETYPYTPESNEAALYPRFVSNAVPLDTNGTANCYIATSLNTAYSFDATVMGNGRTTTNLRPQPLRGAEARVLWETGTVRGAVIKDTEYKSGRIVFTTGTERGNAVIGLFDASGNCVWSWHIWSVDYAPAASAQTYKSGAVFMDRNLGALTTDYTKPESRGLYYQWGRKDPMIYPSLFRSNQWNEPIRADAVYAAGFEYAESHPRDVASPYDIMTVEWAVAHPTTYMDGAFFEDWEEWTSVSDWLHARNSNLWGNRTTGKTIVMATDKSIYDPCPPGWRVPDLEDFRDLRFAAAEMPYCVTVYCNGTQTATYPLGGFLNVTRYERNGENACLYTASPYTWNGSSLNYFGLESASISVTGTYQEVNSMSYYRYAALPVRCVRE